MGSQTLLPIPFLRQLIRFYGDSIERMVPSYLQVSLDTLAKEQERFRKKFAGAFTPAGAFEAYQEQARKNLAMFEQAMACSPRSARPSRALGAKAGEEAEGKGRAAAATRPKPDEISELKSQLATMQAKLEKLSRDRELRHCRSPRPRLMRVRRQRFDVSRRRRWRGRGGPRGCRW